MVIRHVYLYYEKAAPVLPDREFDLLWNILKEYEEKHPDNADRAISPINIVGVPDWYIEGMERYE